MIKDINFEKVEDLALAVLPIAEEDGEEVWKVYVINLKKDPIEKVMVSSKGYGPKEGKEVKTSTLRHFFEIIYAEDYALLEILPDEVTDLNNEFWVSFWYKDVMYDKKYVFVRESLTPDNFTQVPILNKPGVMIK